MFVFALFIAATSDSIGQYSSKKIEIKNDKYYGTVEVCQGCDGVTPVAGRTYVGLNNNELQFTEGKSNGKLLHGTAKLFFKESKKPYLEASFFAGQYHKQCQEWTEDGEYVMNANYQKGVKHGKVVNYVFGSIETEDMYDNGKVKATTYFDPESKKPISKVETLSESSNQKRTKVTYYGRLNVLEAERQETWNNGQLIAAYYDGAFINKNRKPTAEVVEKGRYKMNQRVGTWHKLYNNGVKATTEYDHDKVKSEKFTKDGKPFTGEVVFSVYYPKSKKTPAYTKIQVKNGVRNGSTTYRWGKNTNATQYTNGKIEAGKDFYAFMKGQKVEKEYTLKKQCDGRGKGLYVEKVQVTDKNTIVYCHYRNIILATGAGLATPAPGQKDGFTMIDTKTKKVNKLIKSFFIQNGATREHVYYGEMIRFVLIFDKLPATTKTVSFVEGDEAYVTQKNGSDLYKWGCYDLRLK